MVTAILIDPIMALEIVEDNTSLLDLIEPSDLTLKNLSG